MSGLQRILHAEDDPSIQAVARLALEMIGGYQVLACSSGHEALQQAVGFAPQLILLDVMMPGMDGLETLARLRALIDLDRVPVVFMTAKAQPEEVEQLLRLGACDVIVKPFDPMQLAARISSIWEASRR